MKIEIGKVGTKFLFENEYVKVWDLTLASGEATDWHEHLMDYMFVVIKNGRVRTEYIDGTYENQDDEVGHVEMRRRDKPHRLVNSGDKVYMNIVLELKKG